MFLVVTCLFLSNAMAAMLSDLMSVAGIHELVWDGVLVAIFCSRRRIQANCFEQGNSATYSYSADQRAMTVCRWLFHKIRPSLRVIAYPLVECRVSWHPPSRHRHVLEVTAV